VLTVTSSAPLADAGGPYEVPVTGASSSMLRNNRCGTTEDHAGLRMGSGRDGGFGETGDAAERGDETGMTPTFRAVRLPGLSSVEVRLRVTDDSGLTDEDVATVSIVHAADLTLSSSDIRFSPINPDPGQPVTITATVSNRGLTDAGSFDVHLSTFGTLLGTATINSLAAGAAADVAVQTTFADVGFKLIKVTIDAADAVVELNEATTRPARFCKLANRSRGRRHCGAGFADHRYSGR